MHEATEDAKVVMKELVQDILAGRFKDAWKGRGATRKKTYKQFLERVQRGERRLEKDLGFHKRMLSITDREEEELLQELQEREMKSRS